eukprot:403340681
MLQKVYKSKQLLKHSRKLLTWREFSENRQQTQDKHTQIIETNEQNSQQQHYSSAFLDPKFDKENFQKQFDLLRPPQNEYFDKKLKVYGVADGQFLINHYWVSGSVIVFPNRFYMWNILDPSEIKPHTLEILNFVKPRPDYLIIGTGEQSINLDEYLSKF